MKKLFTRADDAIFGSLLWATSTKAAFYILTLLIIISAIIQPPTTLQGWLLLVVSIGYQGVALPGVGYASKQSERAATREGEQTRKLTQETHDAVMSEIAEVKQMHAELHERLDRAGW